MNIRQIIEQHGYFALGVSGGPSFTYTIGLTDKFGFELLMVGLNPMYAKMTFDAVVAAGKVIIDAPTDDYANVPVVFKKCSARLDALHENYVLQADRYYGRHVEVVQIVIGDRLGRLPGDPKYDHAYMDPRQPLFYDL